MLEIACSACGRGCHPEARFCGWCGAARTASALAIEPLGERKQATILFADIVDSTKLIAGGDAEAGIGRLQPVIAAMEHGVKCFDGTILGILGDGLIAAFGAPRSRERHALLACRAALAMRGDVAALPNPTMIRIGLHSGEVITGTLDIRSSVPMQAQGMTLHIASRVETAAEPGEIYLTRECRALVSAYCDTVSAGVHQLKGVPAAVELFRLIGLKPAVASDQFRDSDLTRLRGREHELGMLKQALLGAAQKDARAIGIT
ncbi:MAG: adenylate/guanylate cyclase domain-containing protein, partial [Acetobacteraceae bacterium]